ncbi:unnamed protein product [Polarella glacialis]|uniref:Uncharacterized protein n=1 Tax=Polarella glacialis TaxID=89957 RepID=A0A813FKF4_POLGL|nr:unnamed protein product [Polarella glacialis]
MTTDETGRKAAFERIHEHYEQMGLSKWADDAFQLRGSQEDYDKVKTEGCSRSPQVVYEEIKARLASPDGTESLYGEISLYGESSLYGETLYGGGADDQAQAARKIDAQMNSTKSLLQAARKIDTTPSRSLLQAQSARNRNPSNWADEAYQVAECDRQGAYDEVMTTDETGRKAAFERIHEHYEQMGLSKWADDAFQLRGSQEDYDKVNTESCSRSPQVVYEEIKGRLASPDGTESLYGESSLYGETRYGGGAKSLYGEGK